MRKNVAASAKIQLSQIQSIYEKHPYPAADDTVLTKKRWNLAPTEWIMALWRPEKKDSAPERILVAGCGTGSLRASFPKQPSSRSISVRVQSQSRKACANARQPCEISLFTWGIWRIAILGKSSVGPSTSSPATGFSPTVPRPRVCYQIYGTN